MSEAQAPKLGTIGWADLTVPDADKVRDFYADVVGWKVSEVPMGGYADYCMTPPGQEEPAVGVCHARGANADLPPVWLVYFIVESLEESTRKAIQRGGSVLKGPVDAGGMGKYAVVRDPAGAVAALFERAGPG